jgi:SAM-dependent methyltransferase
MIMTVWDKIYKNHNKGGKAWATLSEGIIPRFIKMIEEGNYPLRSAFDIGCGTGKYLVFLKNKDFDVSGIDSSPTAVEMTQKALGQEEGITCADMFVFEMRKESRDLIISVSTIHHGTKNKVNQLIDNIYEALVPGGKTFITLPDVKMAIAKNNFKDHIEIGSMTWAPIDGPEKGLPHSFYEKAEIESIFRKFQNVEVVLDEIGRWIIVAEKKH